MLWGCVRVALLQIYALLRWVQHGWRRCREQAVRGSLTPPQQVLQLRERSQAFDKLPSHLAVVVDCVEELGHPARGVISMDEIHERLASLACWCAALDVKAVTIYDADGCVGRSAQALDRAVQRRLLLCAPVLRGTIDVRRPCVASMSTKDPRANTGKQQSSVVVTLLSALHGGAEDIAVAARQLAYAGCSGAANTTAVGSVAPGMGGAIGTESSGTGWAAAAMARNSTEQQALDLQLTTLSHLTAGPGPGRAGKQIGDGDGGPDLLLRFGKPSAALTTNGFSPWHLRVTEI